MTHLPVHEALPTLLEQWRGRLGFFEPLHGNNGDKLIEYGALEAIRAAGIRLVADPSEADVLLFNGGAGLTDVWVHAFETLRELSRAFPKVPLVVMPSTIQFQDPAKIHAALGGRAAPAYVFCRERYSLENLQRISLPEHVEVALDHDMAFALAGSPLIADLLSRGSERHHLLVERADLEGVTGQRERPVRVGPLKRFAPVWMKRPLKRQVLIRRSSQSDLAREAKAFLQTISPRAADKPLVCFDASRPDLIGFRGFCRLVAASECVISTRLHVGILAAMLNKRTFVVSGIKKLNKIKGIYEYSLADHTNTRLVAVEDGKIVEA